jgi:hypothetical protein
MKTNKTLKIATGLLILPMLTAQANEGISNVRLQAQVANPFAQGTAITRLSQEQKNELLEYALNSKSVLSEALKEAAGQDLRITVRILSEAVQQVVVNSFGKKQAEEMLMRHVLNQALELTVGLPTSGMRGLLDGTTNQELIAVVLEDSIKLAIQLAHDDRVCIENGTFANRPVMRVALERLQLASQWAQGVFEVNVSVAFQKQIMQHFLTTAVVSSNQYQVVFAEEIVKANNILEMFDQGRGPRTIAAQDRRVRGELKSIVATGSAKLRSLPNYKK